MEVLLSSFVLGIASAASPCLLPLYPAFLAFLASRAGGPGAERRAVVALYGLVIVLGVVTAIAVVAVVVSAATLSLSRLLSILVPLSTIVLVVLGVLLLAGRNPFAAMAAVPMPAVRQPLAQAYVYGLMFGPVALPCAGPFLIALLAISIGAVEVASRVASFVAFGVGMGVPLILLSLVGAARGRAVAAFLARHHVLLMRVAGILLIVTAFAEPVRLLLEDRGLLR